MDINLQTITIYGDFVTSLTAYYSCADISLHFIVGFENIWENNPLHEEW